MRTKKRIHQTSLIQNATFQSQKRQAVFHRETIIYHCRTSSILRVPTSVKAHTASGRRRLTGVTQIRARPCRDRAEGLMRHCIHEYNTRAVRWIFHRGLVWFGIYCEALLGVRVGFRAFFALAESFARYVSLCTLINVK